MWEDDVNKEGGRWIMLLDKASKGFIDKLWHDLVRHLWSYHQIKTNVLCIYTLLAFMHDWGVLPIFGWDMWSGHQRAQ